MRNLLFLFGAVLGIAACSEDNSGHLPSALPLSGPPSFVGSAECKACHQAEFDLWQGSHHQLAMQVASAETVLGDFSGKTVEYFDSDAVFFTRSNKFFARLEDADGNEAEFEITHTFGVTPLQQYLVDASGGRKQALQFAWDSRAESDGGQRWYHLYPDEYVDHKDALHWTGRYFNWNYMCAECHSTNVELGYDLQSDSFETTFDEVSVGCESCHGPGQRHVNQASGDAFNTGLGLIASLDDRAGAEWVMNSRTGIAERSIPNLSRQEVESCGRCHARRSTVASEYQYGKPLADTHMPALLDENLYHADGRIQEEVYVYGSFIQSKMYAAGVTCSDCHNPHSGQLRAGPDPNDTCATCHLASTFATVEHNPVNVGECVTCHMPATTYMGVDDRRDHSFRLPDTDSDPDHYGAVIAAGRSGNANSGLLRGISNLEYPAIARATMLTLLEPLATERDDLAVLSRIDDPDPLVRIGVLRALRQQIPKIRLQDGSRLLRDPVRSVRVEAALTYVEFRDLLPLEDSRAFVAAADEYRASMLASASMPDAAINLAEFENRLGNTAAASQAYEHAIEIGPDQPHVQHAFGLYKVRSGDYEQALEHLRLATTLAPDSDQFSYVYGVALNSLGDSDAAIDYMREARIRFPDNFEISHALVTFYRDAGDIDSARALASVLMDEFPSYEHVNALVNSLQQ